MPLYTYECSKCDQDWPVVKSLANLDKPEPCPHCESTATERVIKVAPAIKVWAEGFNPALGKVIRSRAHLQEELRKHKGETGREMLEVGNECPSKIEKSFAQERKRKVEERWSEPVEKIAQEVLGEGISA
jgi:putative FmdB family regulatory protein